MSGSQTWFPESLVVGIGPLTRVEPGLCVPIPPAFLRVRKSSDELFPVCIVLVPLVYELFNKVIKMLYLKTVNYPEPLILYSTFHVA